MAEPENVEILFPRDFGDYAFEVEAKGVFSDASVRVGTSIVSVTFYDSVRLAQDMHEELKDQSYFAIVRLIIVPSVTEEHMRRAVDDLPVEFLI